MPDCTTSNFATSDSAACDSAACDSATASSHYTVRASCLANGLQSMHSRHHWLHPLQRG